MALQIVSNCLLNWIFMFFSLKLYAKCCHDCQIEKLGQRLHLAFGSTHFYNWMLSIIGKSYVVLVIKGSLWLCDWVEKTHHGYFSSMNEIVILFGRYQCPDNECWRLLDIIETSQPLSSMSAEKMHREAALSAQIKGFDAAVMSTTL